MGLTVTAAHYALLSPSCTAEVIVEPANSERYLWCGRWHRGCHTNTLASLVGSPLEWGLSGRLLRSFQYASFLGDEFLCLISWLISDTSKWLCSSFSRLGLVPLLLCSVHPRIPKRRCCHCHARLWLDPFLSCTRLLLLV